MKIRLIFASCLGALALMGFGCAPKAPPQQAAAPETYHDAQAIAPVPVSDEPVDVRAKLDSIFPQPAQASAKQP